MMKGRIAIPIHDHQGQLVAYCGRAGTPEQVEEEGKYKLPPKFVKSAVVYNLHRQAEPVAFLVLVESYLSVWKLWEAGFLSACALMDSDLSKTQEKLILELLGRSGRVVLLFDGDESGQACTADSLSRLASQLFVKAVVISPYGRKPHQLESDQLKELLTT